LQHGFRDKIPGKHFVAAVILIYDHLTGNLDVCTGGNYLPVVIRMDEGSIREVGKRGYPIGFIAKPFFESEEITLRKGDKLLMFTDGIVEAKNRNNQYFTKERIFETVQLMNKKSVGEIKINLLKDLLEFTEQGVFQADDVTVMVIEFGQQDFFTQEIQLTDLNKNICPAFLSRQKFVELNKLIFLILQSEYDLSGNETMLLSHKNTDNLAVVRLQKISKNLIVKNKQDYILQGYRFDYDIISGCLQISLNI